MGAKSEALAKQFEVKAREAMATLEQLTEADWRKVTEAEKWSVGVTAHHFAGALEPISHMVKAVAAGQSLGAFSLDMLDEMNAQHAKDHADCTKPETIALHQKGVAVAAATIRGLSDDQLARSAALMTGAPPMTAEQLIIGALLDHIDEHFGSIRKTVGHPAEPAGREG
ncbi:MAG: DinB family protein [Candidatus Rokuibacteriota bacterium]